MKLRSLALAAAGMALAGCHTDMWVQPRVKYYQPSEFFADQSGARTPPAGTVPRGQARTDDPKYTGRTPDGKLVTELPARLVLDGQEVDTRTELGKVLRVGRDRFTAQCSHCHGAAGDGQGMITKRGLVLRRPPASYHTDRLRKMPIGHFFDVMTNGFGTMFPANYRLDPDERWAVAAYIRALQLSQAMDPDALTPEERAKLGGAN
ncbi:MAG: cytochrome c [Armatimonadetes bacterium]|nr:cytochrome c [Armatimonadota bacterium]MCA1996811.1 cytochrome c [Armatimonadota bacterium]